MVFDGVKYICTTPPDFDETQEYPTVIMMHGAGTRGDDLQRLRKNPFFRGNNLLLNRAIIYAPLCDRHSWFDMFESIRKFARFVYEQKNTDKERLYLVGASMGGYAVWQMMLSDPELYAGAIPICGGGIYAFADRIKHINIWAFHGKKDPIVLCDESVKMVEKIQELGGKAKLTLLDDYAHSAWTYVYENPEPFLWLLECRNNSASVASDSGYDSAELFG